MLSLQTTGHFNKNCPKMKKKKEMEDKNGKKSQRQTYQPCETCGKRITHQRNVGKALELSYVPRGPDMLTKPTMTQITKENPRCLKTSKLPPQANPLLKSLKKIFATTPNT